MRATTSHRDDRVRRHQRHRAGLRPDGRAAGHPAAGRAVRADHGRVLPRRAAAGRAAVHRQHLPVHPGRAPRCPPCSAGCRPRWVTSPPWPTRWASCRSGSPPPVVTRSPPCRRSTCPRTTSPTRPRTPCSPTSTRPRCCPGRSPRRASYPAVDPLDSTSRILDARYVGQEHYDVARAVQRILQRYNELQDIIAILGVDELSRGRPGRRCSGPGGSSGSCPSRCTWPSSSPARKAMFVPLEETISSFKAIVDGKYDHLPEQAFFMCRRDRGRGEEGQGDGAE